MRQHSARRLENETAARTITVHLLGCDPGPLTAVESDSHNVFVGADVVIKILDATDHSRLDREVALAPDLPPGLAAPLQAGGTFPLGHRHFMYACFTRVPGVSPGMGLARVDGAAARVLAGEAVRRLSELHRWEPEPRAEQILRQPLRHGGFVSRVALLADVANLAHLDRTGLVAPHLLNGLTEIAERAPHTAEVAVPVHADCHWGNWLVDEQQVTALLDFEWARFGEPLDDWFFLARFSGRHVDIVLRVISEATTVSVEHLRAGCEVREAAYLTSDLLAALEQPAESASMADTRLNELEDVIVNRFWWRGLERRADPVKGANAIATRLSGHTARWSTSQ